MLNGTELFGYIASFFVAISLLMNGLLALRILNSQPYRRRVVRGVRADAGEYSDSDHQRLHHDRRCVLPDPHVSPRGPDQRGQLDDFVSHHLEDILKYFPDFSTDRVSRSFEAGGRAYVALKDLTAVGFALVQPVPVAEAENDPALREVYRRVHGDLFPSESVMIPVDYITRRYRGLGLVHHLYDAIESDEHDRTRYLLAPISRTATRHQRFLKRLGYQLSAETGPYLLYAKSLSS